MVTLDVLLDSKKIPEAVKPRVASGQPEKIVIVGCGSVALKFILRVIKARGNKLMTVTVIGPTNRATFTPYLLDVLKGKISGAQAEVALNERDGFVKFIKSVVTDVDFETKEVSYEGGSVSYDTLILAAGADNAMVVPGVAEHAHFIKTRETTEKLQKQIDEELKKLATAAEADKISFVVVGAGDTGTEAIGALHDYLHGPAKKVHGKGVIGRVEIVHLVAHECVWEGAPKDLQAFVEKRFEKVGVKIVKNSRVSEVGADYVKYSTPAGDAQQSHRILVWSAGLSPRPLIRSLSEKLGHANGWIEVDSRLAVRGVEGVYAAGDCSRLKPTPLGEAAAEIATKAAKATPKDMSAYLKKNAQRLAYAYPQAAQIKANAKTMPKLKSEAEVISHLKQLDSDFRSPPCRLVVAFFEGEHLANLFMCYAPSDRGDGRAYVYKFQGAMINIPGGRFMVHTPGMDMKGGRMATTLRGKLYAMTYKSLAN